MQNALVKSTLDESIAVGASTEPRADPKGATWTRDYQSQPARSAAAVTPSDSVDLPGGACRALYVGVAGDVVVIFADDSAAVTMTAAAAGEHPWAVKRVKSTGTTATNIVALY